MRMKPGPTKIWGGGEMSKPNSGLFTGTKGSKEVDEVKETDQTLKFLLNPRLSEEQNELIQNVQNQG